MKISVLELEKLASTALLNNGIPQENIKIIVQHLVSAELSGRISHGIVRIPRIIKYIKDSKPSPIKKIKETPVSVLLDGGQQTGLVVAEKAMELAIQKAKEVGIALVGGNNCDGVGMVGYYASMATSHSLIGIATANSSATLAPYGSSSARLGTNPLAIAIPGVDGAIVSDFSTAKMTFGDILVAGKLGQLIPPDILLNEHGQPSRNPDDVYEGAILPVAGHKGSALAVALEILAGPLVAAKAGWKAVPGSWGFLVGAIDPSIFVPVDKFMSDVSSLTREIKESRPAVGASEILIPGERSKRMRDSNLQQGEVEIPSEIVTDIRKLVQ